MGTPIRYDIIINFLERQAISLTHKLANMPYNTPYTNNQLERDNLISYIQALYTTIDYVKSLQLKGS